ncbi:Jade-1 protein [Nymphaea thermarum]|nr:Jade-1 protein [Nymphaea thermarum]
MPRGAGGGAASEMSGRSAGMDLYAQARKALSERSPFETPEEAARIPSLPVRLSAFLSRFAGENSRRKHRRSHHKAEAGEGPHGPNPTAKSIWPTMDDYFRPLTFGDIETLVPLSRIDLLLGDGPVDQCFLNPSPDIGTRGQEIDRECSASTSFQAVGSGAGTEEEENKRVLAAEELGPTVSVEADTEEKPMTLISNSDANGTGLEQANDHHPLEIDTPVPVRVLENGNVDSHCKSGGEGGLPTEVEQEPLLEKGKGRGGRVSKRKLRGDQASVPRGQRVLTRSMFPQVGFVTPGRIEDAVVGGFSSGAGCRVRLFQSSDVAQLVSSTSKVIPPKRSIKKRGLSENDPEVEKLVVSHPKSGDDVRTRCHVCCISTGEETNRILSCASCHLAVHQKCYGVSEVPAGRWLCSWCSHNTSLRVKHGERLKSSLAGRLSVEDGAAKPCVLCPNSGGALKPITLADGEHDNSVPRFSHLFCCLWMPEVHAEDPETLEPIVNIERIKESYKKLPCAVCKVKYGACILCNNASCRTSFHPLCAREAKQGLEIRRKVGSSDVELLAFCSRHSPVQDFKVPESESHVPGTVEDRPLAKLSSGLSANGPRKSKNKMKIKKGKLKGSQLDSRVDEKRSVKVAKDQTLDKRLEQVINTENTNMTPDSSSENATKETSTSTERNGHVGSAACGLKSKEAADSDNVGELPICSLRPTRRSKSGKCSPKLSGEDIQLLEISVQKMNCEALGDQKTEEGGVSFERIEGFDKSCCEDEECGDSKVLQATDERGHMALLHGNPDSVSLLSEQVVGCEDNSSSLCNSRQEPCWLTLRANSYAGYGDCGVLDNTNIQSSRSSSVHPFVHKKLIQMQKALITSLENPRLPCNDGSGQIKSEPSGSSCVKEQHEQFEDTVTDSSTDPTRCRQLDRARKMGILDLSPTDEIEGEILFLQNKLLESAVANKCRCDDLVYKIITGLPRELELLRKQRWDALIVREAKKQGRKEKRFREAQAAAAAATAAAAASSRSSSLRKDAHEEVHTENTHHEGPVRVTFTSGRAGSYSQLVPRAKETLSRLAVTKFSSDKHSEYRKDHHPFCSVCGRRDRVSNRVSVCASCKVLYTLCAMLVLVKVFGAYRVKAWFTVQVAVHMDCYHILKNHVAPWCCELCEDFYRQYRGSVHMNIRERPDTECGLCGRLGGAFRKTTDAQWVHVTCAEWLLESTYVRGQPYPVEGMCSFDDCNSTFHPSCAKEANLYTSVKVIEGRIKHKAYCRAHGPDQMEKVDFEQLRILCERIIRREKLKRDLVMCSHDMLASKRDCVAFSVLYNSSFLPPDVSSCSVTTSLRGCTDDNKSWSEVMQRSDDVTVDSTLSGVRSSSHPVHLDMEIKSSDRSKSIKPYARKRTDEMPTAGKHLPDQSVSGGFWSSTDEKGRKVKCRKHTETLQKEVVMTPIEASVQNQRLPKGFAYVPVDCLAKEQLVSHEAEIHDSHS